MHANAGPSNLDYRVRRHLQPKKKYRAECELSFWYHVDARTLSHGERIGYYANLNKVKAQSRIHQGMISENPDDVYNQFMLAFDDENMAKEAASRALEKIVERNSANGRKTTR